MKKLVALLLCFALVMAFLAGCGKKSTADETPQTDNNAQANQPAENKGTENTESADKDNGNQPARPWIVDAKSFYVSPFYGDLAYVRVGSQSYFINRTGNVEIPLDIPTGNVVDDHFTNGLLYIDTFDREGYLVNTKGEKITAEAFGGTALFTKKTDYALLKMGYIVVDRVVGTTNESAIYNTNLEQVQPYSAQLYELFRNHEDIAFYNGYAYYEESGGYQTYHIATNTFAKYDVFPQSYANEMDFVEYRAPESGVKGLYRKDELILDLSRYETLENVEFVGELGLAKFSSEQDGEYLYHFSLMDRQGNLKFEPVLYGRIKNLNDAVRNYCTFNGNVILVRTRTAVEAGKAQYQIRTYDLQANELGCLEKTLTNINDGHFSTQLGEDTIVITTSEDYGIYYNEKLEPLFPTE